MPFDPNKPFETLSNQAPSQAPVEKKAFDPNKPFEVVREKPEPISSTEGTFDEQVDKISKKYDVSPDLLRGYARLEGSLEASKSVPFKVAAGISGVAQSVALGLPGKLLRASQPENTEKALDEMREVVQARKSGLQEVAEFGAGLLVPTGAAGLVGKGLAKIPGVAKGLQAAPKMVQTGTKLAGAGALTGAAGGIGASKAGEEVSEAATGAAIGGTIGAALPAAGKGAQRLLPGFGEWDTKALSRSFMAPTSKQLKEELIKEEQSKIANTVDRVVDYTLGTGPDSQALKAIIEREGGPAALKTENIFKALSKGQLIKNVNKEIEKLNTFADNLGEKYYQTNKPLLTQMLKTGSEEFKHEMSEKILNDMAQLKINQKDYNKVMKEMKDISNRVTAANGDYKLLINLRKSLQEDAQRAYEPHKQLPIEIEFKKQAAERLNHYIYRVDPQLETINKFRSALLSYQDSITNSPKLTLDTLLDTVSSKVLSAAARTGTGYAVGGTPAAVMAGINEVLDSPTGRLLKLQLGTNKATALIKEKMGKIPVPGEKLKRELIKESVD